MPMRRWGEGQRDKDNKSSRSQGRILEGRWVPPALALLLTLVTAEAAQGQEVQVFRISGRSDNPEFASYSGFGAATSLALPSGLRIRVALETENASLVREGWVCTEPGRFSCAVETGVVDESRRSGLSVTLNADLALHDRVRLSAGVGPHFTISQIGTTSESFRRDGERLLCFGGFTAACVHVRRVPQILVPKMR